MTLQRLLQKKRLVRLNATSAEIEGLLATAEQDLADSAAGGLSDDGRFVFGYGAVQCLAAVVLRASGYKTHGKGHHQTLFEALPFIIPAEQTPATYFDKCREKRNDINYKRPHQASATEAAAIVTAAREFRVRVLAWLLANHPTLIPPPPPPASSSSTPAP